MPKRKSNKTDGHKQEVFNKSLLIYLVFLNGYILLKEGFGYGF